MKKFKIGLTKKQIENFSIIESFEYFRRVIMGDEYCEKVFKELKSKFRGVA